MAAERRSGAPKLIAWTGERFVPWTDDVQVAYEHYHRYLWAASLTKGRRILDVGSGEGFGSAILAAEAASVTGIDIDERTVAHSQLNYVAPNLSFSVGSATDLGVFADDAFDIVVAFEVLEHFVEQEEMLAGIDRVLAPDGLLVISTPDRRMYSELSGHDNPFHERELTESEFRALLATRFSNVCLWGQRTMCGSRLGALDEGAAQRPHTVFVERGDDAWRQTPEPPAMYLVAVAARQPVDMPAAESTLVDESLQLARQYERDAVIARADAVAAREALAGQLDWQERVDELAEAVRRVGHQHGVDIEALNRQLAISVEDARQRHLLLVEAQTALARIHGSVTWSAVQFVRWRLYRVLGEHSTMTRTLQWALRHVHRRRARRRESRPLPAYTIEPAPPAIRFPLTSTPDVSIVVTAHVGAQITEECLRSISSNTEAPAYEVIVVDDAGDAANAALWSTVEGARIIVNEENLGYLRSVNRGVADARGRYAVVLNNDTVVQPGWLSALVARAAAADDIGIVAPMLLYPDGTVQEAGGIIFRDGTGWNYGRGLDPAAATFNYVRDVDYGSGACLLVRTDLWRAIGGYDERYLPMYYEDTDLCFAARDRGFRVVYEPAARVVHVEGATNGTAENAGGKRYQELNRPTFVAKWRDELDADQLVSSPENVRRASDRNDGLRVLVVDHRVPLHDQDSGSLRMKHLLGSLVAIGCRVTFIPDNLLGIQPYTRALQEMGVEVLCGPVDVGLEIAAMGPDLRLAIVSRPVIAPRYFDLIREYAPNATIAYDTVDLHFVREERRAALGDGRTAKVQTLRELELGLVRGSDVAITVTEEESAIISSYVPDARVIVIPNANAIAEDVPGPDGREGIVFVGSFEHPPNADAAIALVRDVMPLVWREAGPVPVKIVGVRPPQEVVELAGPDVEITGWVQDLGPLYASARVMVAPLRYGAGMKGKVTQSLAAGLPVVTTSIGAEGLRAVDGAEMMIADDAAEIASRILRVLREEELWRDLSAAGQDVAAKIFSLAVMRERLEELLSVDLTAEELAAVEPETGSVAR